MTFTAEDRVPALQNPIVPMLHELGISTHRLGYRHLIIAIPCYARDTDQSLSKEVYPYVASCVGFVDWHSVERSIRTVISDAWDKRIPEVWERYFPGQQKAPTNHQFIAVLAERLQ